MNSQNGTLHEVCFKGKVLRLADQASAGLIIYLQCQIYFIARLCVTPLYDHRMRLGYGSAFQPNSFTCYMRAKINKMSPVEIHFSEKEVATLKSYSVRTA